ncbi:hypothetical protein I9W82_000230 [Candida metapsilosis]|uniref:Uncharacterized protein n=1 Tax=Candida metapsilosis TaxID=273372 RepID=A0A8H7ZJS4_9ASCO|nr:hypothetical protein I9W82_000230 [Candida metapsilosis]
MELSDLPVQVLCKILPFENYLLDLPNETIIPWLNLLPQRESFQLLVENGLSHFQVNPETKVVSMTTLSNKEVILCPRQKYSAYNWRKELCCKFVQKVFISFETNPIDLKFYKSFVIFNFRVVKRLLLEYYPSISLFFTWNGSDVSANLVPFWSHFFSLEQHNFGYHTTSLTFPSDLDANSQFRTFFNYRLYNYNPKITDWLYERRRFVMSYMKIIKVSVSLLQLEKIRNQIKCGRNQKAVQPTPYELKINITSEKSDDYYFAEFEARWVSDIFNLGKVNSFSLYYFNSETTIINLQQILRKMGHLSRLELSFGKLDIGMIPKSVPRFNVTYDLKVKIHRSSYRSLQLNGDIKENWHIISESEDYVVLEYWGFNISPQRRSSKVLRGFLGWVW